ncbi:hypothetical protein QN224_15520 [Sinorhizobium sp. 8-89]|uniref:hypothetical protein n=1 Tax=Sinorhizobium sp. 7-81 TaxID=3049087 RepID=UPI0024C3E65C|nr:hypothetical protein [Sinorhizobium sp. 7-81]MDK1386819.1 hypothetical protein [Sinorhizobium sp. 7-81]
MDKSNIKKRIKLHFDGERLTATENGRHAGSWAGVSGKEGLQKPNLQHLGNEGPIPESVYSVGQLQYPPEKGTWDRLWGRMHHGTWPGLEAAWGNSRAWLKHKSGENPVFHYRGKDGFSIHGGAEAGSAGCIDLTDQMDSFADFYRKTGQSADLIVSYPNYDPASDPAIQSILRKQSREQPEMRSPSEENRWEPDPASETRRPFGGLSLRDALRIFE